VVIRQLAGKPTKLRDVLGCLRLRGKPKSLAEMEQAIAAAAAESRGVRHVRRHLARRASQAQAEPPVRLLS
jgi:hypothetical protein